jgi:hypothetical protein
MNQAQSQICFFEQDPKTSARATRGRGGGWDCNANVCGDRIRRRRCRLSRILRGTRTFACRCDKWRTRWPHNRLRRGIGRTLIVSRLVFAMPLPTAWSIGWPLVGSEVIATTGLMVIVLGSSRAKRTEAGPFAVGAWLTGMVIYTPSLRKPSTRFGSSVRGRANRAS